MIPARTILSRQLGSLSSLSARQQLHTTVRVADNEPKFKRDGPAASPLDKNKFDNQASSPGYYEAHRYKDEARAHPNPVAPTETRAAEPEPETPHGQSGSFSDHRGGGPRVDGERLTGSQEAAETRLHKRVGQVLKDAAKTVTGQNRSFSTSALAREKGPKGPTKGERSSAATSQKGSLGQHPGYTTGDAPISSTDPQHMPPPPAGAKPSSTTHNASTKASPPHPDVHDLATGGDREGSDYIHPEDRSRKTWGANARFAQFIEEEGTRNPIHHGGSNEGGFNKDGSSKT